MNPDRDYAIIAARKAVVEARETLAKFPGAKGALRVQALQRDWNEHKKLSLVK